MYLLAILSYHISGISNVSADLKEQLISVQGTAAPSSIVAAIQDTGRDAILRGSGKSDWAAVCILETHNKSVPDPVRGLIRMVQVGPETTVVDLTIKGLSPGIYNVTVRENGDINYGAESTGSIWGYLKANAEQSASSAKGLWGTVDVSEAGTGSVFTSKPIQVLELYGKSIAVSKDRDDKSSENSARLEGKDLKGTQNDPDTLVGVIARSAGVWDNDKTVCSCSGKTVWEERKEQVGKGMI